MLTGPDANNISLRAELDRQRTRVAELERESAGLVGEAALAWSAARQGVPDLRLADRIGPNPALLEFVERLAACHRASHLLCGGQGGPTGPLHGQLGDGLRALNINRGDPPPRELVRQSIVVWTIDPGEQLSADDAQLLAGLRSDAPAILVRDRRREPAELVEVLRAVGIEPSFAGREGAGISLAVLEAGGGSRPQTAPPNFRVTAISAAFNEADIIVASLRKLLAQDIDVVLLDNWSTDGTVAAAETLLHTGRLRIVRFPPDGPPSTYRWRLITEEFARLAQLERADWIIVKDIDEVLVGPWAVGSLRDALFEVERRGFNAVDETVLNFRPTTSELAPGSDFEREMTHFEFGDQRGDFVQVKAWKVGAPELSLEYGGHEVRFADRRIFPHKFLLKHYPTRGQAHGQRKVFQERKPRWDPAERAAGWHSQYDAIEPSSSFVRDPAELIEFDAPSFACDYLMQRLAGAGLPCSEEPRIATV